MASRSPRHRRTQARGGRPPRPLTPRSLESGCARSTPRAGGATWGSVSSSRAARGRLCLWRPRAVRFRRARMIPVSRLRMARASRRPRITGPGRHAQRGFSRCSPPQSCLRTAVRGEEFPERPRIRAQGGSLLGDAYMRGIARKRDSAAIGVIARVGFAADGSTLGWG